MEKYVELSDTSSDFAKENVWLEHCELKQIPFITVKTRSKYADVHWDYITYSNEVDEILESIGTTLRDSAVEIFNQYASKKSRYTASGHLVWFKNLEIEQAREAASDLYDLVVRSIERNSA
ncbi:hypothetical protein MLC59_19370 [Marinobacter bryozoorum]|uniref:hypothetical protein n=1 Tax=Marinobacter bryozoorum TaxID=256324 RepID=UPI002004C889|nr:hypothetical protein [Marinobacter bryozoorum]MCK7546318.1 hypothetical protein [Marinobacter bryozoorum]